MVTLVNRAKMSTSTTGTGTITLGSAESGYQSFADAGVTDGQVVRYVIEDGTAWEIGSGTYTASGTTLSRTPSESSNAGAALNLTGSAVVYVSAAAEDIPSPTLAIDNKTAAYTVVADDLGKIINCTNGTFTVSLTSAATLGAGFNVTIWNTSTNNTDAITIDPSGSETIDGRTTLILRRGEGMQIVCDGTNWQTGDKKRMRGFAENTGPIAPVASGTSSFVIGNGTASGSNSLALGISPTASGTGALAFGWANASGSYSLAFGGSNQAAVASANYSVALGHNSGGNTSQAVTGAGAMALGGSRASGTDSFAAAIANNTSSYGATGANSVAIGYLAKASNSDAVALGDTTTASGANSFAHGRSAIANSSDAVAIGIGATSTSSRAFSFGDNCIASASYSFSIGRSTKSSYNYSYAFGYNTEATRKGVLVFGGGQFAARGDAQCGTMVLRRATTDATPTVLTSDGSTPAGINEVQLPNNSAYSFSGTIVARQQASAGTACAAWKIEGLIRREGSAGTTVLVNSATTVIDNTPSWGMALSADTTNGGLKIEFTGAAATNIRVVATIHTSECTY